MEEPTRATEDIPEVCTGDVENDLWYAGYILNTAANLAAKCKEDGMTVTYGGAVESALVLRGDGEIEGAAALHVICGEVIKSLDFNRLREHYKLEAGYKTEDRSKNRQAA